MPAKPLAAITSFLSAALFASAAMAGDAVPFSQLGATAPAYVDKLYDQTGRLPSGSGWSEAAESKSCDRERMDKLLALSGDAILPYSYSYMSVPSFVYCPADDEIVKDKGLHAELAPGEYEPVTFGLFGLRTGGLIRCEANDLVSPNGKTLSKDFIDVRILRGVPNATITWENWTDRKRAASERIYKRVPFILEKREPFALEAGESRHLWLTVYAPENTEPGVYRGKISLSSASWKRDIPLSIRVLPIKLETSPDFVFNIFLQPDARAKGFYFKENLRKHLQDVKAHGVESVICDTPPGFTFEGKKTVGVDVFKPSKNSGTCPYNDLAEFMDMYAKTGFSGPLIHTLKCFLGYQQYPARPGVGKAEFFSEENKALLASFLEQWQKAGAQKGIRVTAYVGDEPANTDIETEKVKVFVPFIREKVKGLPIATAINGMWQGLNEIEKFSGCLSDIYITNYINNELLESARKRKTSIWLYNNERDPVAMRYLVGFWAWSIDVSGVTSWAYQTDASYNQSTYCLNADDYRGKPCGASLAAPSPEGPLPTPAWEAYREGVDDQKYVYTLERILKKRKEAKASDNRDAEAERLLQIIKDDRLNGFQSQSKDSVISKLTPLRLANYRRAVVMEILKLQGGVKDAAKADSRKAPLKCKLDISVNQADAGKTGKPEAVMLLPNASEASGRALSIDSFSLIGGAKKPAEPTFVKAHLSDGAIHISFKCMDSQPSKIVSGANKRRDQEVWKDDHVEVFLGRLNENGDFTGGHFLLNAGGVAGDGFIDPLRNKFENATWNPEWRHSAKIDADGWTAEMEIPLKLAGVSATQPSSLKILFCRELPRLRESSSHPFVKHQFLEPDMMGSLEIDNGRPVNASLAGRMNLVGQNFIEVKIANCSKDSFSGVVECSGAAPEPVTLPPLSAMTRKLDIPPLKKGVNCVSLRILDAKGSCVVDDKLKIDAASSGLSVESGTFAIFPGDKMSFRVKSETKAALDMKYRFCLLKDGAVAGQGSAQGRTTSDFQIASAFPAAGDCKVKVSVVAGDDEIYAREFPLLVCDSY